MYRDKDYELIKEKSKQIKETAAREYRSNNEPDFKEISDVYLAIKNYIKKNNKIVYGGFAQNLLIKNKNRDDVFYTQVDEAYFTLPDIADIEFYSYDPYKDMILLTEELFTKGFKHIQGKSAQHEGTFKIFINFENYCDITYMPKHLFNTLPTIDIEGIKCIHPHFMLADNFRIITDPMTSYNRLEKSLCRFQNLIKYYPIDLSFINNKIILDKNPDLDFIRKKIIYSSKLILIGFEAYNYYIKKINKKYTINVPYYEIISSQLEEDAHIIYNKLIEKYKNIETKEYVTFFQFLDNRVEYYINGKLVIILYGNNEKCTVYTFSQKKKCYYGTFNLTIMYLLFNYFLNHVNKNKKERDICYSLLTKMYKYRLDYFDKKNLSVLDDTPFQDFSLKCIGIPVNPIRHAWLEGIKKKEEGKQIQIRYEPKGKIENIKERLYPNISGNEILNKKYLILKKNNI